VQLFCDNKRKAWNTVHRGRDKTLHAHLLHHLLYDGAALVAQGLVLREVHLADSILICNRVEVFEFREFPAG
jgi:hypothetical protein